MPYFNLRLFKQALALPLLVFFWLKLAPTLFFTIPMCSLHLFLPSVPFFWLQHLYILFYIKGRKGRKKDTKRTQN